jgi:hypothetical protein
MKKSAICLLLILLAAGMLIGSTVTIGTGTQQARIPVDMYYQNSLYECVYLSSEISTGASTITALSFYNNFTNNVGSKPVRVFLGNTTSANLSSGWINASSLTEVFNGNVTFPSGANTISITLTTPFAYTGGNLVLMMNRPMDTVFYGSNDRFYCQTVGTNRARRSYSDTVNYDPFNPPTGSTLGGQFPKTTITYFIGGLGAVQGTVYGVGNLPVANATVSIPSTSQTYTTTASGAYNFPYVTTGTKAVSVSAHTYQTASVDVTVVENNTVTQDFYLAQMPTVLLTGRVVETLAPAEGISGATIAFTGYEPYTTTTDPDGYFSVPGVYANQIYNWTATATRHTGASGQVAVSAVNQTMPDIMLADVVIPVTEVTATQAPDLGSVQVNWTAPGNVTGTWLHYDDGTNANSIGTGGSVDFSIAVRYPPSALSMYAGTYLYSVKAWPAQAGTFYIRVWTGGSSTAPGTMVVEQAFTPTLNSYNTILLNTPVLITGTEELWFGMRCVVTTGYPAGCDAGPAENGLGNMIYFNNAWSTLTALAPTLDYDWNLQGYVGYSAPTKMTDLTPLALNNSKDRSLQGYKVWRLPVGQEANEAAWTLLNTTPEPTTSFTDMAWGSAAVGDYRWAVKSVYSGNALANAVISANTITRTQIEDISAELISGATDLSTWIPEIFTINVRNTGNTVLLGSTYVVRLIDGRSVLVEVPGVDLNPGQMNAFQLSWTPETAGDYVLSGEVVLNGDAIPANNDTPNLPVVVTHHALPVVLSSFSAILTENGNVHLNWVTQSEEGMLGYRVYRNETPDQSASIQITDVIIPATNSSTAHSYELVDDEVSFGSTYYYWLESVDFNQSSFHGPVSVLVQGEVPPVMPELTTMRSAYPNPFQSGTASTIEVALKAGETGTVSIYNVHGQVVRTYQVNEGYHSLIWNGRDASGNNCGSGIYFYKLSTPSLNQTRRLVLTK